MSKRVYLCGPITGLSYDGATSWRHYVANKLNKDIIPLSPMRGKEYLKDEQKIKYSYQRLDHYIGKILSSETGITSRDRFDVQRCDLVVANFLGAKTVSIGSVVELGWADAFRKPVIMVSEEDNIMRQHPITRSICAFHTDKLDVAVELINRIASDFFSRRSL